MGDWIKGKLWGWAKEKLGRLLDMALSQRTFLALVTIVAARIGLHLSDELMGEIAAGISGLLLVTIMHRPPGAPTTAEVAKMAPVGPSALPTRFFPDPITKQPQAIDAEDPRR